MFGQLKLATKISLGFGALIVIAMILGGVAVVNMLTVKGKSTMLAKEYVPEVDIAMNLRGAANETMYAMRGYGFTEEERFHSDARKQIANVESSLNDAQELLKAATHLIALKTQLEVASKAVDNYKLLMDQTAEVNKKITENRTKMDEEAGTYMQSCNKFLEGQNNRMNQEIQSRTTSIDRYRKITLVNTIIDEGNAVRVGNFKAQATRDPQAFKAALDRFKSMFGLFDELRSITRLEADLKEIDITQKAAQEYVQAMDEFLNNWNKREELAKQRESAGNEVVAACNTITDAGMENTKKIAGDAAFALSASSTIMITGLIIALVLGILLAFFITRSIVGPINTVINGLNGGAEQVASASEQLSSASQQLSEGASEQASSLEEVSSSLEEIASMTKQNAQNARQANGMASEAYNGAKQGSEAMGRMKDAINKIKASSDETAKIVKTIDEIAMQTNLLALNAAVEAARAGDAGRGFAVVAEEVRNLAQRSAQAAKNTANLIEGARKNAENGVSVSEEVGSSLEQIGTRVQKVAQLVSEVSAASDEQSTGIEQVNTAVAQMDKLTQGNAANAEETASASEELSGQAVSLNTMVAQLTAIVGGTENGNVQGHYVSSSKPKMIIRASTPTSLPVVQERRSLSVKNNEKKNGLTQSSKGKVVKPEELIPLDDDALAEF